MQHDPLTRHEDARREIGHTAVSRRIAWMLVGCFIGILGVPGAAQLLSGAGVAVGGPSTFTSPTPDNLVDRVFTTNRRWLAAAQRIEDAVGERSLLVETLRPVAQSVLTSVLGAGTELAYPVGENWLFYGPDLQYVTGKGFLATRQLERRATSGNTVTRAPKPDPRPAILDLHRALTARDIRLIVMPTPVKPTVEFGRLGDGGDAWLIENRSYATLVDTLRSRGVLVFDVGHAIREAAETIAGPLYLLTDTHWRPETVEAVAQRLAEFIADHVQLAPTSIGLQSASSEVTNRGDIVPLLGLASNARLYPAETVEIRRVTVGGEPWRPDPNADILLLGDSFTNVYSLRTMGWGESAGLAEHLSLALGRPIDRISQNNDGAYASRNLLATELRRGQDRLDGKRVVILQFANRELAFGDWPVINLSTGLRPADPPLRNTFAAPADTRRVDVTGTVRAVGPIPTPGSVPYKDQIVGVHVENLALDSDVDGNGSAAPLDGTDAVVYLWGMRDNELTPARDLRPGSSVALTLEPWANVAADLNGINRGELDDPAIQLAEPWWGQLRGLEP